MFIAIVAGALTLAAGQIAFAMTRTPLIRAAIALLFAAPAAVAGYHATFGLAHIGVSSQGWCEALAILGAILVGGMAWARMTLLASPISGHGDVGDPDQADLRVRPRPKLRDHFVSRLTVA